MRREAGIGEKQSLPKTSAKSEKQSFLPTLFSLFLSLVRRSRRLSTRTPLFLYS